MLIPKHGLPLTPIHKPKGFEVVTIIPDDSNKVLFLTGDSINPDGIWQPPRGVYHRSDVDLSRTAIRVAKEQADLDVEALAELYRTNVDDRTICFWATKAVNELRSPQELGLRSWAWLPEHKFLDPRMSQPEDIIRFGRAQAAGELLLGSFGEHEHRSIGMPFRA